MARPFRFAPPGAPPAAVSRRRLLAVLAGRHGVRLTGVIGGPGFGKTALLADALASSDADALDAWLTCDPADEHADHLAVGLIAAVTTAIAGTGIGVPAERADPADGAVRVGRAARTGGPSADLTRLCDLVWAQAPRRVCLLIDDVHEVASGSGGAEFLAAMLEELPGNASLVMASRTALPVRTARLAATHRFVRIGEDELAFDREELAAFAAARNADVASLAESGAWPALAELTVAAGADVVRDFLWEEVLQRLGTERVALLTRFAEVGGGDREVVSALSGRSVTLDDLISGIPLVRRSGGWAELHPLWLPALRHAAEQADGGLHAGPRAQRVADQRSVAEVHRAAGRFERAVELYAEAEAWGDLRSLLRDVLVDGWAAKRHSDVRRWTMLVPARHQGAEALLAEGLDRIAAAPAEAVPLLQRAREGFARAGDAEAELATIANEGFLRWWGNDFEGLGLLYLRIAELHAGGAPAAAPLNAICLAGVAHLSGDSAGVLRSLDVYDDHPIEAWRPAVVWLRSVAHRRQGDLLAARAVIELDPAKLYQTDVQLRVALSRVAWLEGDIESVCSEMLAIAEEYEAGRERVLANESLLEVAMRVAFVGQTERAGGLVERARRHEVPGAPRSLHDVLRAIAGAALAVGQGDEAGAADALAAVRDTVIDGPWAWYWRDRAAIAIAYVVLPDTRAAWSAMALAPAHEPGRRLAQALVAARSGDLGPAGALGWPPPGIVRAHLPARWAAELAAYADAAGNPAPTALLDALGEAARLGVGVLAARPGGSVVKIAATRLLAELPRVPSGSLRVEVLGPLRVLRDGGAVDAPELRRARVRELLGYLAVHRRASRERIADDLWPEHPGGAHNLSVTLNYLQRVFEPARAERSRPYYLRTDAGLLRLAEVPELDVDLWDLEAALRQADEHERAGRPGDALTEHLRAVALWRGEPLQGIAGGDWSRDIVGFVRARCGASAVRASALLLADGRQSEARSCASLAVQIDRWNETAHALHVRALLGAGETAAARIARQAWVEAMAELGVEAAPLSQ